MTLVKMNKSEAIEFLDVMLQIRDVETKIVSERFLLLNEIIRAFHQHEPFQNLTLLMLDPEQRQLPSAKSIHQCMTLGHGGMCNVLNTFCQSVFSALGYQTFTVACYMPDAGNLCTHIAFVVEKVHGPGELYFVDVGASFPTFQCVPLHDLPQEYKNAFHEYKFVREGKSVVRYHKRSISGMTEWQKFYEFQIVPQDAEFVSKCLEPVYVVPGYGSKWYLLEVRMSIYPENKAVTLHEYCLRVWDGSTGKLETKMLLDDIDVECAIRQYFPMLNNVDVRKALKMRKLHKEIWLKKQPLRVGK